MADDGGHRVAEEYEAPRLENKRKFDDVPPEEPSNFSGVPDPEGATPVTYNNVPPPMTEFQLAKERVQQIAARLVGGAEGLKRPRTEDVNDDHSLPHRPNNPDHDQGYPDHVHGIPRQEQQQDVHSQHTHTAAQEYHQAPQYNYNQQGNQSRKIDVPNSKVGLVIGKGGETIKYLQHQSGARIQVARDADSDPRAPTRQVELMGSLDQISRAEQLIKDVIAETQQAAAGGAGALVARGFGGLGPPGEQVQIKVPNNKVGLIIGRGGETIKNLQGRSGARIQVQNDGETDPGATERMVTLIGSKKQTDMAYELIKEVIDENRARGPPGGYNQQGSYRPPPQQWGPPAAPPMQQPGYGYQQPSPYPGPPQQYPGPPPPAYGGYPQQTSATGYSSSWDQRAAAPAQQPQSQAGYDYYSQQTQQTQPQTAPQTGVPATTDTSYGYSQPGYYGGYQQPQTAAYDQSGYSQQGYSQQGYGQQAYNGGYGYSQTQSDPQSYSQQGYAQQGYAQPTQYSQSAEGTAPSEAASTGYDYNGTSQTPATAAAPAPAAQT